jgi:hypothetical protein
MSVTPWSPSEGICSVFIRQALPLLCGTRKGNPVFMRTHHSTPIPWELVTFRLVEGGVQLGPLSTAATDWPIVPAPADYDDGEFGGMKFGGGNLSTRSKPAPAPLCPP